MEKDLESRVVKNFTFKDFEQALNFINQVGKSADQYKLLPDLDVDYNKVKLTVSSSDSKTVNNFLSQIRKFSLEQ